MERSCAAPAAAAPAAEKKLINTGEKKI